MPIFELGFVGFWGVFLFLSFMSSLYILVINPLLNILFANISHSVGCLFHFINGFLCCGKVYKFDVVPFVSLD